MSWTYDSSLDQFDHEIIADSSTSGRWTFHRKMRFYPSQYLDWKQGLPVSGTSNLVELINDPNIPKLGELLSGNGLDGFYVSEILSIKSMTDNLNLDPYSYAIVTILYLNMLSNRSSGSLNSKKPPKKPWEELVQDFQVINVLLEVPFLQDISGNPICTPAGQPFYDVNTTEWYQRITWTHNDKDKDYSLSAAVVNNSKITLMNKIDIAPSAGLLLPPGYRRLYYTDKNGQLTPYDQWTFLIIVKRKGHDKHLLSVGTKFDALWDDSEDLSGLIDICYWYVAGKTPSGVVFQRGYGSYKQMLDKKDLVERYNYNLPNSNFKLSFSGDLVTNPVPITSSGDIDHFVLDDPEHWKTDILDFKQYNYVNQFNIGLRWKENQSGNY